MSEWKENVILESVCAEVLSGGTPRTSIPEYYLNGTVPWLKTKEVTQNRIYKTENFISREGLENSAAKILPVNSIVVAMFGDGKTAGRVGLTKLPLTTNQACCNLVIDPEIACPTFIFYQLIGKYDELVARKTGSGQQNLSPKLIRALPICLPALDEQRAIANMLSSLDDKIDLLHRQNKTLEAMAETVFRQQLEASKTTSGTLGSLVTETLGGDWGTEVIEGDSDTEVRCVRGTDLADLRVALPRKTPCRFIKREKLKKLRVTPGDIIFEISGGTETQSTGRSALATSQMLELFDKPLVFSNFCRLLRPLSPDLGVFLYFYLLHLYDQDEFFALENGSSGIKNLAYRALLNEFSYPLPSLQDCLLIAAMLRPYVDKFFMNKIQIQTLERLRDTLLPKLMSGEVRVQYE